MLRAELRLISTKRVNISPHFTQHPRLKTRQLRLSIMAINGTRRGKLLLYVDRVRSRRNGAKEMQTGHHDHLLRSIHRCHLVDVGN